MDLGYVFHCTPCGFSHAGECAKNPCVDVLCPSVGEFWGRPCSLPAFHTGLCHDGNPNHGPWDDPYRPMCQSCPAGFCHGKRHHAWVKEGKAVLIDLWNTYHCSGCKRTIKRSAVEVCANVPTERWAGPCLPQS